MTFAIQISRTGGPEVLDPADVEVGDPGPGEAVVDVAAAGVNFIDIYYRTGTYAAELPLVVGKEGAGRVVAVGPDVTDVAVGDRVAWSDVTGSYAERVVAPVDALVPVPDGVDDHQAAAFPLQGMTAQYLATDAYRIRPGDTVLIHAGAGGVGLILTQIATLLGARVLTTVSTPEKAELSRAAGAAEVLPYADVPSRVRELTDGEGVAAVYDSVGKDTFDASLASVRRRGTLVLFGASSGPAPPFDPQRLNGAGSLFLTRPKLADHTVTRDELLARSGQVLGWMADGKVTVRVGGTYPLAEAARAHEDLAARRTTGKLLLLP